MLEYHCQREGAQGRDLLSELGAQLGRAVLDARVNVLDRIRFEKRVDLLEVRDALGFHRLV